MLVDPGPRGGRGGFRGALGPSAPLLLVAHRRGAHILVSGSTGHSGPLSLGRGLSQEEPGQAQPGGCALPLGPFAGLAPRVRLEEGLVPSWLLRHRPCEAASGLCCHGGVLCAWARGPGRSSTTPAVDSKCIFASFFFFQICILQALISPAESNLFKLHLLQRFPMFQGVLSMGQRRSGSPDLGQDTRWRGDSAEFGITQTSVRILLLPSSLSQRVMAAVSGFPSISDLHLLALLRMK